MEGQRISEMGLSKLADGSTLVSFVTRMRFTPAQMDVLKQLQKRRNKENLIEYLRGCAANEIDSQLIDFEPEETDDDT